MIYGYDISHWNNVPANLQNKFLICKASEGINLKDSKFLPYLIEGERKGAELFGAYHFAKTGTDVNKNVINFLSQVKATGKLGKNLILALDLEGADLKRKGSIEWARQWLDLVYSKTGIRPLIYIQGSEVKKCGLILEGNYGLWVAHYTRSDKKTGKQKEPTIAPYPFYTIWQYSNGGGKLDHDIFNGNKEQFLKYCKKC